MRVGLVILLLLGACSAGSGSGGGHGMAGNPVQRMGGR